MRVDGDRLLEHWFETHPEDELHWRHFFKLPHDPRVLPVIGRLLRRTRDVYKRQAVDGEKAGLVCDATADSISESIGAWLAKDLIERGEFRNRARACFVKHYELSAAFEKHTAVLRAHLRRKSHSEPEQHHMAEAEI